MGIVVFSPARLARLRRRRIARMAKVIKPRVKTVTPTPNAALTPSERKWASEFAGEPPVSGEGVLAIALIVVVCCVDDGVCKIT